MKRISKSPELPKKSPTVIAALKARLGKNTSPKVAKWMAKGPLDPKKFSERK